MQRKRVSHHSSLAGGNVKCTDLSGTIRGFSPAPLSLECVFCLPSPCCKLLQGHRLEIVSCCSDHLDWTGDWAPLRPLSKSLRLWQAGVNIYSSCGHSRQDFYVNFLAHYQSGVVFQCLLCMEGGFRFHQEAPKSSSQQLASQPGDWEDVPCEQASGGRSRVRHLPTSVWRWVVLTWMLRPTEGVRAFPENISWSNLLVWGTGQSMLWQRRGKNDWCAELASIVASSMGRPVRGLRLSQKIARRDEVRKTLLNLELADKVREQAD